ncbi:MAG: hypothetical protein NTZ05_06105, partial [Chloroflexi bacterium]|nr:hypothetical protein [Chloroflexota bacterium]
LAQADDRSVVCRIALTGRGPLHRRLLRDGVVTQVRDVLNSGWSRRMPFFWCERLEDRTALEIDRESRRQAGDFIASVLQLADELRSDPAALDTLRQDLAPLLNHAQTRKHLGESSFTDADLLEALRKAEDRILDALAEAP